MLTFVWVGSEDTQRLEHARELFAEYQVGLGIDLCFQGFDEELRSLPGRYGPPSGALMVVYDGEQPVACGAVREIGVGISEMKRLYIRPTFRQHGLGRKISEMLIAKAVDLGYRVMRLDTLRRLEPAVKLYESLGFREVEPYNYNPEPDIAYYEISLASD